MKKGLLILLALLGIAIFFMTKNMKNSLKAKKGTPNEKMLEFIPTITPTKSSESNQSQTKNKQAVENSKEEEEYEEYEPENTPSHHNQPHSTEINQNPNIHKTTETAPIAVPPPPVIHHATPAPTGPVYVQPTAPPVEKLAPLHVRP